MKKNCMYYFCDIAEYTAKMIIFAPVSAALALVFMFFVTFSLMILGADFEGFDYISCYLYMLPFSFTYVLYRLIKFKNSSRSNR